MLGKNGGVAYKREPHAETHDAAEVRYEADCRLCLVNQDAGGERLSDVHAELGRVLHSVADEVRLEEGGIVPHARGVQDCIVPGLVCAEAPWLAVEIFKLVADPWISSVQNLSARILE